MKNRHKLCRDSYWRSRNRTVPIGRHFGITSGCLRMPTAVRTGGDMITNALQTLMY